MKTPLTLLPFLLAATAAFAQETVTVPVPAELINDGTLQVTGRAGANQPDSFEYVRVHADPSRPGDLVVDEGGSVPLGKTIKLKAGIYQLSYSGSRYAKQVVVGEGSSSPIELVEINIPRQDGSYRVEAFVDFSAAEEQRKLLALGDSRLLSWLATQMKGRSDGGGGRGPETCEMIRRNKGDEYDLRSKAGAKKLCASLGALEAGKTVAASDLPIHFGDHGSYTVDQFTSHSSDYAEEDSAFALLFNLAAHQTYKEGRIYFDAVKSEPMLSSIVDPHDGDTIAVFPGKYLLRFTGVDGHVKTVQVVAP